MSDILIQGPLREDVLAQKMARLASTQHVGANSCFLGRVRADEVGTSTVVGIEYSAYETMARQIVSQIDQEARAQFGATSVQIWHSTGLVRVGEASLLVVVSSAHRRASFRALEYAVDQLKLRFPAWKKEIFADGTHRWIGEPGSG